MFGRKRASPLCPRDGRVGARTCTGRRSPLTEFRTARIFEKKKKKKENERKKTNIGVRATAGRAVPSSSRRDRGAFAGTFRKPTRTVTGVPRARVVSSDRANGGDGKIIPAENIATRHVSLRVPFAVGREYRFCAPQTFFYTAFFFFIPRLIPSVYASSISASRVRHGHLRIRVVRTGLLHRRVHPELP